MSVSSYAFAASSMSKTVNYQSSSVLLSELPTVDSQFTLGLDDEDYDVIIHYGENPITLIFEDESTEESVSFTGPRPPHR